MMYILLAVVLSTTVSFRVFGDAGGVVVSLVASGIGSGV